MTAQQLLAADFLDILFEYRNKAYGAYAIRRSYAHHMWAGVGGMLLLVLLASAWVLRYQPGAMVDRFLPVHPPPVVELIPWNEHKKSEPAPRASATARPATQVDRNITLVPDDEIIEHPVPDRTDPAEYVPGAVNAPATGTGAEQMVQLPAGGTGNGQAQLPLEPEEPAVFHSAEVMPVFPGGEAALYRYLQRMLRVPEELEPGSRKTVQVRFVVNASGEVTDIEILRSAGASYDREVIRVVERMPRWKPGKQNGRPVSVYFTQPVTFAGGSE